MRSKKLAAICTFGAAVFIVSLGATTAAPGQKKPGKPAASAGSSAQTAAGRKVYEANGCKACHVVGTDKGGKTGPDLTHVAKTRKADYLTGMVRNPKKANPKSAMPAYGPDKINDSQLKSLVAYLSSLK